MPQPWQLVADALRHAIADETYRSGDRLPSEHQLAEAHGVSRPTVRRALQELRLRGLIETQQGRGAFVRAQPAVVITLSAQNYRRHQETGQSGFAAQVREQGYTPRQEVLGVSTVPAPQAIAQRLGIEVDDDVVLRRLRFFVDDEPVQLVKLYYEPHVVTGTRIERPIAIPGGTHSELLLIGVQVTRFSEEFMGARLPHPEEQEALRLPSGVPVIRNVRTAYAIDRPVEVLDATSHGEMVSHRFDVEL